jgi:hypothetical protein
VLPAGQALSGAVGGMWIAQQAVADAGTSAALVSLPLVGAVAVALALRLSYAVSAKPAAPASLRPAWLRLLHAGTRPVASLAVVALWAGVALRADESAAATNAAQRNIGELSLEAQLLAVVMASVQR